MTAVRHAGFAGQALPGLQPERLFARLGPDPLRALPSAPGVSFVKDKQDKGTRVYCLREDLGRGEEELFVKTFDEAETFRVLRGRMRDRGGEAWHHYPVKLAKLLYQPSLARRSFRAAAACARAGVPVAEHLLYLSRRRGWLREEVLVTAGVNPRSETNAKNFFLLHFPLPCPPGRLREKRALLEALGRLLRSVQDSGFIFPDFKLHNLVLREGDPRALLVIDLAEVTRGRQDEATFMRRFLPSITRPPVLTAQDRLRLLRAYLAAGNDPRPAAELCRHLSGRPK